MRDDKEKFSIMPIIDHKLKCIYVHIPKNASSTIRDCLFGRQKELEYILYNDVNSYIDYFKFTFVRHPYQRFLSFYKDNVCGKMMNPEELRNYRGYNKHIKSVNDLLMHIFEYGDNTLDYHLKPQSWFTEGIKLDFIGKVENFDNDINKVKIILDVVKEHGHLRQTINKYGMVDAQKNMLYKKYRKDFENFSYNKED